MPTLQQLVPDTDTLQALDPEELGVLLLRVFADRTENRGMISLSHLESELFPPFNPAYPRETQEGVLQAIREAFAWLEGQALLIWPDTMNGQHGWRKIGRRGHRLVTEKGWQDYKQASLLPKDLLHSRIQDSVYLDFQRGDYQTAVFKAFREVEIVVREKSGIAELGVKLMRRAFDKDDGPLRDSTCDEGERESRAHLFAGAIGSYKNPHSHRSVTLTPKDAVEMLVLASHLLRIAGGE
jgi:uncharacterized protein (TIGR02391 family)